MNLKEYADLRLQVERDKQIWTDRDMLKAGFCGILIGIIISTIWMI
jgi:hypothetical protein